MERSLGIMKKRKYTKKTKTDYTSSRLTEGQLLRIKYYQQLADAVPIELENREGLYASYLKYIEMIRKEK